MTAAAYNVAQNKLSFAFGTSPHRLSFLGASYAVLGFNAHELPQGTTITSTNTLRPRLITDICLSLGGVTPSASCRNLDNFGAGSSLLEASQLLCRIPLSCPPFDVLHYEPRCPSRMMITEKALTTFRLSLTSSDGLALTFLPDHTLVLKVECFDPQPPAETLGHVHARLGEIADLSRMNLLSTALDAPSEPLVTE